MLRYVQSELVRLFNDEQGAEGLEKILIIAAIVLPLLGVLLFFKDSITEWLSGEYSELKDKTDDNGTNPFD